MTEKRPGPGDSGASSAALADISAQARKEADLSARERLLQAIIDAEPE